MLSKVGPKGIIDSVDWAFPFDAMAAMEYLDLHVE